MLNLDQDVNVKRCVAGLRCFSKKLVEAEESEACRGLCQRKSLILRSHEKPQNAVNPECRHVSGTRGFRPDLKVSMSGYANRDFARIPGRN